MITGNTWAGVAPNPAYLNNRCHHWLARDAEKVTSPVLDPGENLDVAVLSREELEAEVKGGTFRHSLAISALSQVFDLRELLP